MNIKFGAAAFVAIAIAIACSSPTAPTQSAMAKANLMTGAAASQDQSDVAVCAQFNGEARGLCPALLAMNCDEPGGGPATCDRLIARFLEAEGDIPPFITRFFVSRDPQVCQSIVFLCGEGFSPFFEESGCGCQRNAP